WEFGSLSARCRVPDQSPREPAVALCELVVELNHQRTVRGYCLIPGKPLDQHRLFDVSFPNGDLETFGLSGIDPDAVTAKLFRLTPPLHGGTLPEVRNCELPLSESGSGLSGNVNQNIFSKQFLEASDSIIALRLIEEG
ncbi:MAG: hypothetical protein KDA90_20895, partial [Planctomycetaceae bacterium]|nr:hypothetical protein [Planctomycetaceae bacterium]